MARRPLEVSRFPSTDLASSSGTCPSTSSSSSTSSITGDIAARMLARATKDTHGSLTHGVPSNKPSALPKKKKKRFHMIRWCWYVKNRRMKTILCHRFPTSSAITTTTIATVTFIMISVAFDIDTTTSSTNLPLILEKKGKCWHILGP